MRKTGTEIRIELEEDPPPSGRIMVSRPDGAASDGLEFVGWLGLLRALSDAIEQTHRRQDPADPPVTA